MKALRLLVCAASACVASACASSTLALEGSDLYRFQSGSESRWVSPENPTGAKGAGARENQGAKGRAFETIPVGGSHVLADIQGAGTIDRMWMTIEDRSPEALRGLRLDIYWDCGASRRMRSISTRGGAVRRRPSSAVISASFLG